MPHQPSTEKGSVSTSLRALEHPHIAPLREVTEILRAYGWLNLFLKHSFIAELAEESSRQPCTRSLAPWHSALKESIVFNLIACHLLFLCLLPWLWAPQTLLLPTSLDAFILTERVDVSATLFNSCLCPVLPLSLINKQPFHPPNHKLQNSISSLRCREGQPKQTIFFKVFSRVFIQLQAC